MKTYKVIKEGHKVAEFDILQEIMRIFGMTMANSSVENGLLIEVKAVSRREEIYS